MSETMRAARANMIEAQIRSNDVTDPRILAALAAVAREQFVPSAKLALAYSDVPVEVAPGRYLLDPRSLAKALQLMDVRAEDRALDVGCGTGYSSAVLARLAQSVVALEQDADLVRVASQTLEQAQGDIDVTQGALIEGFKMGGPYDVILVNGGIETRPDTLLDQLAEGGRLVCFMSVRAPRAAPCCSSGNRARSAAARRSTPRCLSSPDSRKPWALSFRRRDRPNIRHRLSNSPHVEPLLFPFNLIFAF